MKRTLVKGGYLRDIEYDRVQWSDYANITDYELVFLNLDSIAENKSNLATPDSDIPISIHFPSPEKVGELLAAGNDLFAILPRIRYVKLNHRPSNGDNQTQRVDLLSWLPFTIKTKEEQGKSVKESSVDNHWKWYFGDNFDWPMYFDSIRLNKSQLPYSDLINITNDNVLAENVANQDLALHVKIVTGSDFTTAVMDGDNEVRNERYSGNLYLIPLKPNLNFSKLASGVLYHLYNASVEPSLSERPDWLEGYLLPRQEDILNRIRDLKSEFHDLNSFKVLLYGEGDELEEAVVKSFKELGFQVDGETPTKRDGKIILDNCIIAFEVGGTNGPIGRSKCDQLARWVQNQKAENPNTEVHGLLIGNPYKDMHPRKREKPLAQNARNSLEQDGNTFLSTITLYKLLGYYQDGKVTFEEIADELRSKRTDFHL